MIKSKNVEKKPKEIKTKKSLLKFNKKELRNDLYPMFLKLIKNGFKTEAYLLMLSTWNFACFRYALRGFNLDKFIKTMERLEPLFKKLKKEEFKGINFDKYSKEIKIIFNTLSKIKGIQKTGAPKLMHLAVPKVFVMWDTYIRKYYGLKRGDFNDYMNFLKLMQKQFPSVKPVQGRTIAKLIDEHNFKTITEPIFKK